VGAAAGDGQPKHRLTFSSRTEYDWKKYKQEQRAMLTAIALSVLLEATEANIINGSAKGGGAVMTRIATSRDFNDLGKGILKCYHGTARFRSAHLLEAPWHKQPEYGADRSALIRISYLGASGQQYSMMVGLIGKQTKIRAAIQSDNAKVPASGKCGLNNWTG
jgi:hypothetical protein